MARLTATLTVLFFLFAFSNARTPLDRPENNVVDRELPKFSPESDAKPTLLLPSQKPESDPTNVVQPQPHTETQQLDIHTDAKRVEITEDLPAADTRSVDAVPLLKRPINRHFPPKRPYNFHHPRRGCHHGINPAQVQRSEVSYGDDMILAGDSKDFNRGHPATFPGGDARDIPEQRVGFQFDHHHHHDYHHHHRHHHDDHHHEGMPRFPMRHHDMTAEQRFRKPFRGEEEEPAEQHVRILAGESKDFNTGHPATFPGGDARYIPEQRVGFQFDHHHHHDYHHHHRHHHDDHHHDDHHHHEGMPRFPMRHHDMTAEQRFRKPFRGEEEEPAEQHVRRPFRREQEEEREEDDSFMKGFGKFLNYFN